ncbi:hypothetical protein CSKR_107060 [Clonorchis sinensis]|uniref:Uncharacterized protein n=1 Tax=Clonorchis sinensis TaxID=79923 RepID=A0A3R7D3Z2_CLOSI|nr:hypothetical protein CSKR_107060 [Clonorchis sinensis]
MPTKNEDIEPFAPDVLDRVYWRKLRDGQRVIWQKDVKEITKSLGVVGVVRLPGWGPRDAACAWLETLQEMTAGRYHRSSCFQFLSRLSD